VILENLEFTNGFLLQTQTEAETNLFGDSGAALLVAEWSCVTAVDCVFSNNRAVRSPPSHFTRECTRDIRQTSTTVKVDTFRLDVSEREAWAYECEVSSPSIRRISAMCRRWCWAPWGLRVLGLNNTAIT
jgi:hypothetical protein